MQDHKLSSDYSRYTAKYNLFGVEKEYYNIGSAKGPPVPVWLRGETLYEIYIRAFSEEGTFEGVRKNINRLVDLGIRVVWFMPVFPIGVKSRKGSLGSPYAIRNYFTVNPEYGTEYDFHRLISELHQNGIRVILDMVANHVAPDYVYLAQQPDMVQYDGDGLPKRAVEDWSDIVDLDYGNPNTWEHMRCVMLHWINNYDIDGYRCDVAGLVPVDFWNRVITEIRDIKPDFFMLAEWESTLLHQKAFHSTYDWILYCLFNDFHKGGVKGSDLVNWLKLKKDSYPENSLFLRFLENHDKKRAVSTFERDQVCLYLILLFSLDGIPLLYNGQETGDVRNLSLFEKMSVDWSGADKQLFEAYQKLIEVRRISPALYSKEYSFLEPTGNEGVLAFKKGASEPFFVLINFNNTEIGIDDYNKYISENTTIMYNTHHKFDENKLLPYQGVLLKMM